MKKSAIIYFLGVTIALAACDLPSKEGIVKNTENPSRSLKVSDQFTDEHPNSNELAKTFEFQPVHLNPKSNVKLINLKSRKCIDFKDNHEPLAVIKHCWDEKSKNEFSILRNTESSDPYAYKIVHQDSGKCLEIDQNASHNGAVVLLAKCSSDSESQNVNLVKSKLDHLFYNIIFPHSHQCLDVFEQSSTEDTRLHTWDCANLSSQSFFINEDNPKGEFPKKIWTFWDKGERAMPAFYRANLDHWRKLMHDWDVRVVNIVPGDADNFHNFIGEDSVPTIDYLAKKIDAPKEPKLNPYVVFSDFVRLELLYQHGGVWLDPSIMLHETVEDFVSILDHLGQFNMLGYTSYGQSTESLRYADSLENFFLMSYPHTPLIEAWKRNFKEYWEEQQAGLSIENHPMFNGSKFPKIDVFKFSSLRNYLNQHLALKFTLVTHPELVEHIFILGGVLKDDKGPFTLLQLANWSDKTLCNLSPKEREDYHSSLAGVWMSKFPSENSTYIRAHFNEYEYFFKKENIFGQINDQELARYPAHSTSVIKR